MMIDKWIGEWIALVFRRRWWVLLSLIVVSAVAAFEAGRVSVDTDNYKLIRRSGQWVEDLERFQDSFPANRGLSYVLIEGATARDVYEAARGLARRMQARPDLFEHVFVPQQSVFLLEHSLYFQTLGELAELTDRTQTLEPVLTGLESESGLDGLVGGLAAMLDAGVGQTPARLSLLRALVSHAEAVKEQGALDFDWRGWVIPVPESARSAVIRFRAVKDYATAQPDKLALEAIDVLVAGLDLPVGTSVRVTGDVALDHDEIRAALESVKLAGTVSLLALAIILTLGVRSLRTIVGTYVALAVGLIWTLAFANLFVGPLNTISIVFVVMFIGLGLDFSIHYCLRAVETFDRRGRDIRRLVESSVGAWRGIMLAAGSTAIGFLAFVPTDYRGLAELGMISAAGMAMAVLSTYVVLPLFFAFFGLPTARARLPVLGSPRLGTPHLGRTPERVIVWMYRHTRTIVMVALAAGLVCLAALPQLRFDFNTLALKDPDSPSMRTLAELRARAVVTNYALALVVPADEDLDQLAIDLQALPSVGSVMTPADVLPTAQSDKRRLMRSARGHLRPGIALEYAPERLDGEGRIEAFERLGGLVSREDPGLSRRLQALWRPLGTTQARAAFLAGWEQSLLAAWPEQLAELLTVLGARPFEFEDLPAELRSRLLSPRGDRLVRILPAAGFAEGEGLWTFVEQVQMVAPHVTGRPVVEHEAARVMLKSLYQALAFALVGLSVLLLLTLRRPLDVGLVLFPIMLAALFTAATMVMLDLPFNMANILVAPLIFGLGLDGSIHILERFRERGSLSELLNSSTPWAVYLSYLTTLVTFGSLALSTHQGMKSIGLLLVIALTFAMLCVIIVFSALLHLIEGEARSRGSAS
jgi:hopanoid biosynthesis associated RND transporter like protein HpnN